MNETAKNTKKQTIISSNKATWQLRSDGSTSTFLLVPFFFSSSGFVPLPSGQYVERTLDVYRNVPLNSCFSSTMKTHWRGGRLNKKKHTHIESIQSFQWFTFVFIKIDDLFSPLSTVYCYSLVCVRPCVCAFIQLHLVYKDIICRASLTPRL